MKHIIVIALTLFSLALKAELTNELVLILKPLSSKKDPVKKELIRATYLARVFNYDLDRVITINFKNAFAEDYHTATVGARELVAGEVVRIYSDYPGLVDKLEAGKPNVKETLVEELYQSESLDHSKLEKLVTLAKSEVLMNCQSPYLSLIVTKGKNYFLTTYLLAKDGVNTVLIEDDLYTIDYLEAEKTLVLDRIFGKIFVTLKDKKVEGLFFDSSLHATSLPAPLSNTEKNPAKNFVLENDLVNDGLSCSSFKLKNLLELNY